MSGSVSSHPTVSPIFTRSALLRAGLICVWDRFDRDGIGPSGRSPQGASSRAERRFVRTRIHGVESSCSPQRVERKASGSGSPQAANRPHHLQDALRAGRWVSRSKSSGRSDGWLRWDKIVKLPCGDGCEAGMRVRPIFENSTACTCQMPIFFSVDHFLVGGGLFWINSWMSV